MKFSTSIESRANGVRRLGKLSQLLLVSALGVAVAVVLSGCQLVTIDYVYLAEVVSAGGNGQIQTFAVDSQSGALRASSKKVDSGGPSPVAMAVSGDYANLYVANTGNNSVAHFSIASDGTLASKDSVTLPDVPVYIAVNAAGSFLYAISGANSATLTVYPLSKGAIGTAAAQQALTLAAPYDGDTIIPTGVTATADNKFVYVTAYDRSAYNPLGGTTSTANPGWLFGFSVGQGGALTPVGGSPYRAGVKPTAIAADPTSRFVYVTDFASNHLIGYTVLGTGSLSFMINGPFRTGSEPLAITVDPRGKYLYVANSLDSSVSAYVIDLATGSPSSAVNVTGGSVNITDTQPVSIVVDPALGRYVYTSNLLGNSVSGFRIDPNAGSLQPSQSTPYPSGHQPTAIVSIPHGNHSTQAVFP